MNNITILEAKKDCAKIHNWKDGTWQTVAFSEPKEFTVRDADCGSIDDLHAIVAWMETQPRFCMIQGKLVDGQSRTGRRTLHDQLDMLTGIVEPARFRAPDAAEWLCLDIDKIVCPQHLRDGDDADVMAARLEYLVGEFPAEFQNASFVYQWSASAGLRGWDTLSAHFFYWIENPVTLDALKARAKEEAWPCDLSLINPVQVHYTAAPIFNGRTDPLAGRRVGMIRKERDAVLLPAWSPALRVHQSSGERLIAMTTGENLIQILDRIDANHLHGPIRHAVGHYIAMTPNDDRDRFAFLDDIKQRVRNSGHPHRADFEDQDYLDRLYDGADFKYETVDTAAIKLSLARKTIRAWKAKNKKK